MPSYVLALDQGTSSSRAVLFDHAGLSVGIAQHEFGQYYPRPGWVEHDPLALWQSQLTAAREVLSRCGVASSQLAAIGIANQRETSVLWDRVTGQPLMRAIVWQDRRTADYCSSLRQAGHEELVRARTGLLLDPYFSATKLKWMLDHIPGARQRALRGQLAFGTIDSWLTYQLTGAHVTDQSNASRTMLFNLHQRCWDTEMLDLFDIPAALLPEVVASSDIVAYTRPDLFGTSIPVSGLAGDQQAATFGQGCHRVGTAKNTIGTGSFLLMNVGDAPIASPSRLLSTIGWTRAGRTTHLMEGSAFMAGAALQWLHEDLGIADGINQVESLAASVKDAGGVVLVPAFTGLGAPHWDPYARGAIFGLHRGTGRAHIARAAFDGIAQQCVDVLTAIQTDTGIKLSELRVDGGGARSDLLLQILADALGVVVIRPTNIETTALGAAQLAGLGAGLWEGLDEVEHHWKVQRQFTPVTDADERAVLAARWRQAIDRSRNWDQPLTAGGAVTAQQDSLAKRL